MRELSSNFTPPSLTLSNYNPRPLIMSSTGVQSILKEESTRNIRQLLKVVILFTIAGAAVSSRLFSVIRKLPITELFDVKIC